MTLFIAIILGIIQGLTEFLPISSTAHLTIAGNLLGLIDAEHPEKWTAFIAVIQLGTMAAVIIYFARDVKKIPLAFVKENFSRSKTAFSKQTQSSRLGWLIITGTIPIVIIGFSLKNIIESNITKEPTVIAFSLIGLALLLLLAEKIASFKKEISNITILDSVIIGVAQALALIPGASRSGTTITAGLFLGLDRESAARFSFLLSIPAVMASGLLEFYQSINYLRFEDLINLIAATVSAGFSGYATIALLLKFLRTHSTMLFIIYRVILGLLILLLMKNYIL
jgi:undecaprenyl-diphosphatase